MKDIIIYVLSVFGSIGVSILIFARLFIYPDMTEAQYFLTWWWAYLLCALPAAFFFLGYKK